MTGLLGPGPVSAYDDVLEDREEEALHCSNSSSAHIVLDLHVVSYYKQRLVMSS